MGVEKRQQNIVRPTDHYYCFILFPLSCTLLYHLVAVVIKIHIFFKLPEEVPTVATLDNIDTSRNATGRIRSLGLLPNP
jgi:hypothetical protein